MPQPVKVVFFFGFVWIIVVQVNFKSAEQNDDTIAITDDVNNQLYEIELEENGIITSVIDTDTAFQNENFCLEDITPCHCHDPETPHEYDEEQWLNAVYLNRNRVQDSIIGLNLRKNETNQKFDIVFFGDSIMEHWSGSRYGEPEESLVEEKNVFESFFTLSGNGSYDGVAFGISGDTSPNLLWRLQNGELPSHIDSSTEDNEESFHELKSKVWWLLIGTNDFGRSKCSAKSVEKGISTVLDEIMKRMEPEDIVVVNSLLPRGDLEDSIDQELWDKIQEVNKALFEICEKHRTKGFNVEFFNQNDIFFEGGKYKEGALINTTLMPDLLHPSALGYKLWGEKIAHTLEILI